MKRLRRWLYSLMMAWADASLGVEHKYKNPKCERTAAQHRS